MKRNNHFGGTTPAADPKMIQKIADSPQARELATTLSRQIDSATLERIAGDASRGDTAALSQLVKSLTARDDTAKLLQQLKDSLNQ